MRRGRYQSRLRLTKKLEEDVKARTDVSRKSSPWKEENTLVPEITFSDIRPNETMADASETTPARLRRSSRLNTTDLASESARSSTLASVPQSPARSKTLSTRRNSADSETAHRLMKRKAAKPSGIPELVPSTEANAISDDGGPRPCPDVEESVNFFDDGAPVNDENCPKNAIPEAGSNKNIPERSEGDEEEPRETSMCAPQENETTVGSPNSPETRNKDDGQTVSGNGDQKNLEDNLNGVIQPSNNATEGCHVLLERVEFPDFALSGGEIQPEAAQTNDGAALDVSIETLEIRKRIERKCLRDSASSDDEDHQRPGVADSEKLFDTLMKQAEKVASLEVLDSSSYYQGKIPSRLLSPEKKPRGETERGTAADGLTERFETFKQSNSQKLQVASSKSTGILEAIVPSFTLEEEAANDLSEVTRRAITLCTEYDSDADLDVVMKSKSLKSAAAGSTTVDPVFCDIATSMGFPPQQKDTESLVLMIDSTSRASSDSEPVQSDVVMRISRVDSLNVVLNPDACISEGDLGDEMKQSRKSKLQSTFLPSPKCHADIAVGTGPSLMASYRDAVSTECEQTEEMSIDDEEEGIERSDQAPDACDQRGQTGTLDVDEVGVEIQEAVPLVNQCSEPINEEPQLHEDNLDAPTRVETPPKLLGILHDNGALPPEEESYATGEIVSDGEITYDQEEEDKDEMRKGTKSIEEEGERNDPLQTNDEEVVEDVDGGQEDGANDGRAADATAAQVPALEDGSGRDSLGQPDRISESPSHHSNGNDASRERNSLTHALLIQEESSQKRNPLVGMDDLPLLELIDENVEVLDLPEFTLLSSQNLSEPPSRKEKSRVETPRLLFHKETPKSKNGLSADYRVGRDIRRGGKTDTPLTLFKEVRKSRLSRRTLFDEAAEFPTDILLNTESTQSPLNAAVVKRRKTFVLDSTRLPSFDDAYVETEFDARELKRRGEELFQSAARKLLGENPETKVHIQHALEDLLTTHQEPIKRMMSLLVKKYALKEACEARKESYLRSQTRLARTRQYIVDTASKLMPENESNVVKVFGFNPFEFKEPPPEAVREINKRKAAEDEERLKKRARPST